jgi:hypothetical protein
VNTMNIPGFTAEESLHNSSARYREAAARSDGGRQRVVSQLMIGPGGPGGGSGGLNAWGCWESTCCTTSYHWVCNPFCHWVCNEEPCTRCIWPY